MADRPTRSLSELRRLAPYLKRYQRLIVWGLVFITISNVSSTTIPRIVGAAVDGFKAGTYTGTEHILQPILLILLLTLGSGLGMFATRRTIIVMSRRVEEDLRNDFLAALQFQDQAFYHDRSTGSLLAHFTNDIQSVRAFIGPAIMYTANTVTVFLFALSWMMIISPVLTLAIVVPIPFIAWATYTLGRKIHQRYHTVQEQYELVTTHAQEAFSGIRVVRAYDREEEESARFDEHSTDYYRKSLSLARVQAFMMPSMTVLFNLSYIVVLGVGGWLVIGSSFTVGDLTQFFIYLNQMIWPIGAIGWVTGMIQRGAASMGRLGVILDSHPTIADTAQTDRTITRLAGEITFRDVWLQYPSGTTPALRDVSFHVPVGGSLGILGPVGSGKSSIMNLIPRLFDATNGTVLIDGHDVRTIPLDVLRSGIAVVPQESFLFSETIAENIRFGRPDASDEMVRTAAERAHIDGDIQRLPNGYDTVVGERGVTLSGGQKQRTALARAIACQPAILILDDALSAVDTHTEARIVEELTAVMRDRTTIIIAHRISTLQHCDTILVLQDGVVTERGRHDALLELGGHYAETYQRQLLEEQLS